MLPDRVSNPGPLTYKSGALPIALRGPAKYKALSVNVDRLSTITPPRYFTKLCSFANFSDHPSVDLSVQVHNSEAL